jgi:uncharacterized protein YbcI
MEESSALAYEQLEQNISQRVIVLYQTLLGHQLNQVSSKLVDQTLTIIAEDSITRVEQFLAHNDQNELASQVRLSLYKALEPHLKFLIEEVVAVSVLDVLCNSAFDTGRTSIVAILAAAPDIGVN